MEAASACVSLATDAACELAVAGSGVVIWVLDVSGCDDAGGWGDVTEDEPVCANAASGEIGGGVLGGVWDRRCSKEVMKLGLELATGDESDWVGCVGAGVVGFAGLRCVALAATAAAAESKLVGGVGDETWRGNVRGGLVFRVSCDGGWGLVADAKIVAVDAAEDSQLPPLLLVLLPLLFMLPPVVVLLPVLLQPPALEALPGEPWMGALTPTADSM